MAVQAWIRTFVFVFLLGILHYNLVMCQIEGGPPGPREEGKTVVLETSLNVSTIPRLLNLNMSVLKSMRVYQTIWTRVCITP